MRHYPLDKNSDYDQNTIQKLHSAGFTDKHLSVLDKNPEYICGENNYFASQKQFSQEFYSLSELLSMLKSSPSFLPINYAFGVNEEDVSCYSCGGSGYSTVASMFDKTYYEHNKPYDRDSEAMLDKDGNLIISKYGWGSRREFTESDFEALKEAGRVDDDVTNFEEFKVWAKNPLSLCSSATYILVKHRSAPYEESHYCSSCKGDGSLIMKANVDTPYGLYLWVTNLNDGNCGAWRAYNLTEEDIQTAVEFLEQVRDERSALFDLFIEQGMELDTSDFVWQGEYMNDSFYSFDNFDEFTEEFGNEPDDYNEFVNFTIVDGELIFWAAHPRKGKSQAIMIKDVNNIEAAKAFFVKMKERNNDVVYGNICK